MLMLADTEKITFTSISTGKPSTTAFVNCFTACFYITLQGSFPSDQLIGRHTAGSCSLQIDLANDGSFIFTSDHIHIQENWEGQPQG
jgi:hypothetical protein